MNRWYKGGVSDAALADSPQVDVEQRLAAVIAEMDRVTAERDQYKKLYLEMLELCRKLERGIVGPKREKLSQSDVAGQRGRRVEANGSRVPVVGRF